MSDQSTGFLARWNLRRQKVQQEQQDEVAAELNDEPQQSIDAAVTEGDVEAVSHGAEEEQLLTAEELPDPESIEVGGSFASFMADNVDPATKSAALRALWKQPQYNEIDGLLEYALDYTNQPKLTSEQSAELVKKVFRHITKDDEEQEEIAAEDTTTAIESETAMSDEHINSDNLDEISDGLSQNEPELQDELNPPVV